MENLTVSMEREGAMRPVGRIVGSDTSDSCFAYSDDYLNGEASYTVFLSLLPFFIGKILQIARLDLCKKEKAPLSCVCGLTALSAQSIIKYKKESAFLGFLRIPFFSYVPRAASKSKVKRIPVTSASASPHKNPMLSLL